MKRFLPLLMMAALVGVLAVGCAPAEETKTEDGTPQITEVTITDGVMDYGELLTVMLQENPTTGYTWDCKIEGDNVRLAVDKYIADESNKDLAGAGGQHDFVFEPTKAGTVKLTFTSAQQWEGGETDKQVVIEATTNEVGIFTNAKEVK